MGSEHSKFPQIEEPLIFALDIGTRSVTGLVGNQADGLFTLLDMECIPHDSRAMVDGQIEDIEQVAKVAAIVKQRLSERTGDKLSGVHVAAAGRALKTVPSTFSLTLDEEEVISNETVNALELGGIDAATAQLTGAGLSGFNCVGHSVLRYYLNDYKIATLVGHKGGEIRVDMIVTFLPREVVDSLNAVVQKIGSSIETLTLEPIAAMNAVIPQELRLLNLALVDIGAGTSDIAVSNEGTVTAYTMATVAGDEVSEAIVNALLVDFTAAENIKFALSDNASTIEATDILGNELTLSSQEALDSISLVVDELASTIAQAIIEVNDGKPRAVFLVGGGSKTPLLKDLVAKHLDLDATKVAVGGNNYIKKSVLGNFDLSAPEHATPVGIAITAAKHRSAHSGVVTINGKKLRTFTGQSTTVVDLLLSCGYNYDNIIGRIGKRVQCTVDGERRFFNGGHPIPAKILLNGKVAAIKDLVNSGDEIVFTEAHSGFDAQPLIADVLKQEMTFDITLDGELHSLDGRVYKNSKPVDVHEKISDGDVVQTSLDYTLGDLAEKFSLTLPILLNSTVCAKTSQKLVSGDDIQSIAQVEEKTEEPESVATEGITVMLNGNPCILEPKRDGEKHLFLDVLNHVDMKNAPKKDIILTLNGKPAAFLDELEQGDSVQVICE